MARRANCRRVGCIPSAKYFKPQGIPLRELDEIILTVDEFEALRLADLERLYQNQAADEMNVSRQTFGRIIESAHRKVAQALVEGKALRIEGGEVQISEMRRFCCRSCRREWELPSGTTRPTQCAECGSSDIYRAEAVSNPESQKKEKDS